MTELVLTSNKVSFSFDFVMEQINNGDFDECDFLTFPDLDGMLSTHDDMRSRITQIFKTKSQPDTYAITLLILFYKINPVECNTIKSWEEFSNKPRFNFFQCGVHYPNKEDELKCLCGHFIQEVFIVEQGGFYCIMGDTCITKSSIYNSEEMKRIERVDCDDCGKNRPRPKPYDLTQDICKRCVNKRNKYNIPPNEPNDIQSSQNCLGCRKTIPENRYRPRCIKCYIKTQNVPYVERRTL